MNILGPAVRQTSEDKGALPSPVSGSARASGMGKGSVQKHPMSECMKIVVNTIGFFSPCV